MTEKLDKIKARISALLNRADHHATGDHEAAACREKAEALMQSYRIERAMLNLEDNSKRKFEVKEFDNTTDSRLFLRSAHFHLMRDSYKHAKCQVSGGFGKTTVVGYPEDVFYGTVLFQRACAEFIDKLYPKWDEGRSFQENCYRLKRSGLSFSDVLWRINGTDTDYASHTTVNQIRHAVWRWEEDNDIPHRPHSRRHDAYRDSFADAFIERFKERLQALRDREVGEENEKQEYAVAIIKDDDALKEEFYRLFPHLRPKTKEQIDEETAKWRQKWADEDAAEQARREKLTQAERDREDAKMAREDARRAREWERFSYRNRKDTTGWVEGTSAADKVRLRMDDEFSGSRTALS